MVAGITGNCVAIHYNDQSIEIVGWTELNDLDTSKRALLVRVFQKNDCIQESFEDQFHYESGFESISLRCLRPGTPQEEMMIRGTSESPASAKQTLTVANQNTNLPTEQRAAAHGSMQATFILVDNLPSLELAQATDPPACTSGCP